MNRQESENSSFGKPGDTVYGPDRARILDLLYNFGYAYDAKDLAAVEQTLTEDMVWICHLNGSEKPVLSSDSRQFVLDWIAHRERIMSQYDLVSHDLSLQPVLSWIDANTVRIKSTTLNILRSGSKPPRIVQSGISDSLVTRCSDGEWRFSQRTMHLWGRFDPHVIGRTLMADVPFTDEADDLASAVSTDSSSGAR